MITTNKLMTIFIPSLATISVLLSFSLFVVVVRALNSLSKFEVYMWHLKESNPRKWRVVLRSWSLGVGEMGDVGQGSYAD